DLPVGTWRRELSHNGLDVQQTITSTVSITAKGAEHVQHAFVYTWTSGCPSGKFAGRPRVSWTQASDAGKVVRIGDEIYIYPDPASKARLLAGDPPGYSLEDYESLGGTRPAQVRGGRGDPNMIDIFKIQGRDLLLLDSVDHKKYLFQRVK